MSEMLKLKMPVCKGYDKNGKKCKYTFTQVNFIAHRVRGCCSAECLDGALKKGIKI